MILNIDIYLICVYKFITVELDMKQYIVKLVKCPPSVLLIAIMTHIILKRVEQNMENYKRNWYFTVDWTKEGNTIT